MLQKNIKLIVELFREALHESENKEFSMHDLNISVEKQDALIALSDDNDHTLASKVLFDFLSQEGKEKLPFSDLKQCVVGAISELQSEGFFEQDVFEKPFSIIYSESSDDLPEELLLIDEELIRIDDPLLENLDEDLDAFIKQLLSE